MENRLLGALLSGEYKRLLPHLQRVNLSLGEVVYNANSTIRYVYFPETAVVSMLAYLEDGSTTEVGLIGREGMVGLTIFLGGAATHDEALVQIAGSAMRMKSEVFKRAISVGSPLQILLLRYTQTFLALISQSAVCSQHHPVEERLARWLLMMHDYSQSDKLSLTHEVISAMMGVRRAGVSVSAQALTKAGIISTRRGTITILDREELESAACECYGVIRQEFDELYSSQATALRLA